MKKILLFISILFFLNHVFSQDSISTFLNKTYPAYELNSDLVFIKRKAEYKKYNQSGLLFAGKENFYRLYDSIERVIDQKGQMSVKDFYFLTAPLVHSLQDDHSYYSLIGDYAYNRKEKKYLPFAEKTVIPFGIRIFNDSVYVTSQSSRLYKSRIISINDIPVNKIITEIFKLTSFRRCRYYKKNHYTNIGLYNYPILTYLLFGFHDEVEIEYTPFESDKILKTKLKLLQVGDSLFHNNIQHSMTSQHWYTLYFNNNYSILRITSMPEVEINIHFVNDIFRKIKEKKPEALIIDIGSCSRSFDSFWIILLNYLYEGELSLYECQKEPQNISKYTKKRIKNKEYVIGKYSDINKNYKFDGKVYLITGASTASSAVRFADILRYNNIVEKIFGSETLSKATQYDISKGYHLPVTGIYLKLSIILYYALDKNMSTDGLMPDIEVKLKKKEEFWGNYKNKFVIQKVIDLIENEDSENENTTD